MAKMKDKQKRAKKLSTVRFEADPETVKMVSTLQKYHKIKTTSRLLQNLIVQAVLDIGAELTPANLTQNQTKAFLHCQKIAKELRSQLAVRGVLEMLCHTPEKEWSPILKLLVVEIKKAHIPSCQKKKK